eukprot:CAMPEP_0167741336 /NCGR_PEP_ID=MMETSP0110_2-20121227/800_1 /TAXON_ID=629695 /ORGANISM="Gymnochlora sp., Strain CCMP2014" /LENGTH=1163 /DNA_ID=CAMNT_0007625377 /DNA_START=343 /DNA_END=3833 /DNA_ORIENTATION=+
MCGDKKHTRYGCPKRKAKLSSKKPSGDGKDMKNAGQGGRQINNSGQGGGQGHACFEIPHISDISDDKNNKAFVAKNSTSLLNPLPDNCNQDGPGGPILDSGATSTYAGVTRAPGGTVSVGNGAKLPILARCSLWGIRNVQLVEGLQMEQSGNVSWLPAHAKVIGRANATGLCSYNPATECAGDGGHAHVVEKVHDNILFRYHLRTHIPIPRLVQAVKSGSITCPEIYALTDKDIEDLTASAPMCHACNLGLATRRTVRRSWTNSDRAWRPMQYLLIDYSPDMPKVGANGETVVFYAVDEYSRYGWTIPVHGRDSAAACLQEVLKPTMGIFAKFNRTVSVERVKGDDAMEFKSMDFREVAAFNNVVRVCTGAPYHRNSIAMCDRFIRTVQDKARTLMAAYKVPDVEWPWAYRHAAYLYNRFPSTSRPTASPLELLYGPTHVPDISSLKTFYSAVYVVRRNESIGKYHNVAYFGRFLGYDPTTLGYRVRVYPSRRILMRKDVYFIEDLEAGAHLEEAEATRSSSVPLSDEKMEVAEPTPSVQLSDEKMEVAATNMRPQRSRRPVVRFSDGPASQETMWDDAKQSQQRLWELYANVATNSNEIPISGKAFISKAVAADKTKHASIGYGWTLPRNYKESLNVVDHKEWKEARNKEFSNFSSMKVWEEEIMSDEEAKKVRILPVAEVFDIKCDKYGNPVKRKFRLCAKGFLQIKGVDFYSSYAPVIDADVLRMCWSIAAELGLSMEQFDFTAAFLHAPNDVLMYLELPPGYSPTLKASPGYRILLRLWKAIYGMKQAARLFYKLLSKDLVKLGFKKSKSSPCLYSKYYGSDKNIALLVVHVDDGCYFARHQEVISTDLKLLSRKYKLSHEPLNWYVGLRVSHNGSSIHITCDAYILHCAKRFGLDLSVSKVMPAKKMPEAYSGVTTCRKQFQEIMGCLMYASNSCRPDVSTIVSMLSSHLVNPSLKHLQMAKEVLMYLYTTRNHGLKYDKRNIRGKSDYVKIKKMEIEGYFDSDFAGDSKTRRSRTGNVIYFNNNLVYWRSSLQSVVSHSVFEAETMSGCSLYKHMVFLRKAFADIVGDKHGPRKMPVYGDNERAVICANNYKYGRKSKHFEIRLFALADAVQREEIVLYHIPTADNPADILTKIVSKVTFSNLIERFVAVAPISLVD